MHQTAQEDSCPPKTVREWWRRWHRDGVTGLVDEPLPHLLTTPGRAPVPRLPAVTWPRDRIGEVTDAVTMMLLVIREQLESSTPQG